jgi:hypothetical protein
VDIGPETLAALQAAEAHDVGSAWPNASRGRSLPKRAKLAYLPLIGFVANAPPDLADLDRAMFDESSY